MLLSTWAYVISDLLCIGCSDAWKTKNTSCSNEVKFMHTWNMLMQSMELQIMGPKYNSHLKYFG